MAQNMAAYRNVVRETLRASISPHSESTKKQISNFRAIFEKAKSQTAEKQREFDHDIQNAITFMHSQRMYKTLLERYNPTAYLTEEERIQATAHRVGLDVPKSHSGSKREEE